MSSGDGLTWYAYYCLHKFHWPPTQFLNLSQKEKAAVMVFIDEKIKTDKKTYGKYQ